MERGGGSYGWGKATVTDAPLQGLNPVEAEVAGLLAGVAEGEQIDMGMIIDIVGHLEFPEQEDGQDPAGGAGIAAAKVAESELGLARDVPQNHAAEELIPSGMGEGGKVLEVDQGQHGKTAPGIESGQIVVIGIQADRGRIEAAPILMEIPHPAGRVCGPGTGCEESGEESEELAAGDGEHFLDG